MKRADLQTQIRQKKSVLCVGLDSDYQKLPASLQRSSEAQFNFNKAIIDATHPYAVAYKPNTAFYESRGLEGWQALEKTARYLKENYPHHFLIADAKRGDIGNTSRHYARAFFEQMPFDAITVAPYMGSDSVLPFYEYGDKWVILLALTSNEGSMDFQHLPVSEKQELYQKVISKALQWGTPHNTMLVVGATQSAFLQRIRQQAPQTFFLVPGVGAQGGDLKAVLENGLGENNTLLINSSRGIIFKSSGNDFAEAAAREAAHIQAQMALCL